MDHQIVGSLCVTLGVLSGCQTPVQEPTPQKAQAVERRAPYTTKQSVSFNSTPSSKHWYFQEYVVDFENITRFKALKTINLEHSPTDLDAADMKTLGRLPQLKSLYLSGYQITDKMLQLLIEQKPKLHELRLFDTDVTDAGLHSLTKLTSLRVLFVPEKTTDKGLKHLARTKSLRRIVTTGSNSR